jgi:sec-independent protein translocase protein TatB
MFDLSWSHIAILVVVALLVLGPKELPNAIRTGAELLRAARRLAGEFRSGMDELLREAELDETRKAISQAMSEGVENTIAENVDPTGEIKAAVSTNPLTELDAAEHLPSGSFVEHDAPPAPAHSIAPPSPDGPPAVEPPMPAVESGSPLVQVEENRKAEDAPDAETPELKKSASA